ncbi:MAG: hypothetical protein IJV31_00500 [Clostridia bacterium]|nr:hypothetical protein [Clostridia bacterium]
MKNIKKWIIGGLIIGMISGVGIIATVNNNTVDTNAVDTVPCVSDNVIISDDICTNSSEEYTMDVVYTTDWLRVRTNPSFDADIVDVFSPDTAVMRIATLDNGWSKVVYNEEIKYMHSDYLSETAIDYPVDENDIDDTVENNDCITDTGVYYDCDNEAYCESNYCNADYTAEEFQELGVISWGMYRYTWYSELVLTGEGLDIEGRHTDENGFVCDIDNYICVASDSLDRGTIVDTPFGKQGKVYDCGCDSDDIIDCYVSW